MKLRAWLAGLSFILTGCAGLPPAFARDALDELQARIIDVNRAVSPVPPIR